MTANITYKSRPSDYWAVPATNTDLAYKGDYPRALYVGGAGAVVLKRADGTNVTFSGLGDGSILPVEFIQVVSSGTTATGLVALY